MIYFGINIVLGAILLYTCKITQTKLLPFDPECEPFEYSNEKYNYGEVTSPDGTQDPNKSQNFAIKTIVNFDVAYRTNKDGVKEEKSIKVHFPYESNKKTVDEGIIGIGFLKEWISGKSSSPVSIYLAKIQQKMLINFAAWHQLLCSIMNSCLPESVIYIVMPFIYTFLLFLLAIINVIYGSYLFIAEMYWLFAERVTCVNLEMMDEDGKPFCVKKKTEKEKEGKGEGEVKGEGEGEGEVKKGGGMMNLFGNAFKKAATTAATTAASTINQPTGETVEGEQKPKSSILSRLKEYNPVNLFKRKDAATSTDATSKNVEDTSTTSKKVVDAANASAAINVDASTTNTNTTNTSTDTSATKEQNPCPSEGEEPMKELRVIWQKRVGTRRKQLVWSLLIYGIAIMGFMYVLIFAMPVLSLITIARVIFLPLMFEGNVFIDKNTPMYTPQMDEEGKPVMMKDTDGNATNIPQGKLEKYNFFSCFINALKYNRNIIMFVISYCIIIDANTSLGGSGAAFAVLACIIVYWFYPDVYQKPKLNDIRFTTGYIPYVEAIRKCQKEELLTVKEAKELGQLDMFGMEKQAAAKCGLPIPDREASTYERIFKRGKKNTDDEKNVPPELQAKREQKAALEQQLEGIKGEKVVKK